MQTSTDILPTDIECIVHKIFQYLHIYTVRVKTLKEFCDFTNTQYKIVLGKVKTQWLSLQPSVRKTIEMYPALNHTLTIWLNGQPFLNHFLATPFE